MGGVSGVPEDHRPSNQLAHFTGRLRTACSVCQTHAVISEGLCFPSHQPHTFALLATMAPLSRDTASAQQQKLHVCVWRQRRSTVHALRGLPSPWFIIPLHADELPDALLSVSAPAGCLRDVTITTGRVWGGSGRHWEMGRVKFTSRPKSGDRFQTWIQAARVSPPRLPPGRQQWRRNVAFRGPSCFVITLHKVLLFILTHAPQEPAVTLLPPLPVSQHI